MENIIGIDREEAILVSAKKGTGIGQVLESIVTRIPPPNGDPDSPLKALVFDSWFDSYRGVIILVRIFEGAVRTGAKVELMSSGATYEVEELGFLTPKPQKVNRLETGEVGYMIAGIRELSHARIGDTPWCFAGCSRPEKVVSKICERLWRS